MCVEGGGQERRAEERRAEERVGEENREPMRRPKERKRRDRGQRVVFFLCVSPTHGHAFALALAFILRVPFPS